MVFLDSGLSHGYYAPKAKSSARAEEKWPALQSMFFILSVSLASWGAIIAGWYLI